MSPRPKGQTSLIRKVAKVFKQVEPLARAGTNDERGYDYTRATDVFAAVREEFFKSGILIVPSEGTPEYVPVTNTNGGEQITECRLPVSFTIMDDSAELKPFVINGIGRDIDDKSLYKAQTGAQKAMLKRLGMMAEIIDDPEHQDETAETLDDVAPPRLSRKDRPLTGYQMNAIREGMAATGKTEEKLSQMVSQIGKADKLESVQQRYFKDLFKWASDGQGTVTPPKPQVVATQRDLPLPTTYTPAIELKIGNKSISFQPDEKKHQAPYSI